MGHEDGYSYKKWWRNNVYLYAHPSTGRFPFIPSGMDNVFRSGVAPELYVVVLGRVKTPKA